MLLSSLIWLLSLLSILLTVAFFTLFERKLMGAVHSRLGPNKVSFGGLLQPILDAVKLLSKYEAISHRANIYSYHLSPHLALFFSLIMWLSLPLFFESYYLTYSFLVFMMIGSMSVFGVLLGGWSSNSKYSLIGALRSVAQSISYEAVFTTLLLVFLVMFSSFSLKYVSNSSTFLLVYFLPLWLFTTLAETHRAPFDFSESESELVSGFNTEYGGVYFAFIFLSEYSVLILSSAVISLVFFSFLSQFLLGFIVSTMTILAGFIWIRVTFCRFRYDKLMYSAWKSFLPIALFFLLISILFW